MDASLHQDCWILREIVPVQGSGRPCNALTKMKPKTSPFHLFKRDLNVLYSHRRLALTVSICVYLSTPFLYLQNAAFQYGAVSKNLEQRTHGSIHHNEFELFKDYGHVDRLFAINNEANLERHWILADAAGIIHHVEYNQDLLHPRLTRGWMELRNFYGLLGEHHILIGYVGAASFQLTVFRSDAGQLAMNSFFCDIASIEALFQGHFAHYRLTLNA
ncbi:hypothetical protein VNO80_10431 [Phaseolus coccineus]|uniref:Uncharacterized protein n=1 Tax=Phaseolus coccineus TaxID=3886 RepID=A0AAN9RDF1_PHACN